jgi:hypothetical protein
LKALRARKFLKRLQRFFHFPPFRVGERVQRFLFFRRCEVEEAAELFAE